MNELAVFTFTDIPVRTTIIDGEPWFVAADICRVLGLNNTTMALRTLDDDEKGLNLIETPGGLQKLNTVNESGMYALIVRSDKPNAKPFRRWVTSDVLPAIRKTGRYDNGEAAVPELPRTFAEALQLAANQARLIEQKDAELEVAAPKAAQADYHRAADGLTAVGDFANAVKAHALREYQVRLLHRDVWDFLADIGLIIRGDTVRRNQPTAFATERDFVRTKTTEFETNTRGLQSSVTPRLTPAGEGWAWDRAIQRLAAHGLLDRSGPQQISA